MDLDRPSVPSHKSHARRFQEDELENPVVLAMSWHSRILCSSPREKSSFRSEASQIGFARGVNKKRCAATYIRVRILLIWSQFEY